MAKNSNPQIAAFEHALCVYQCVLVAQRKKRRPKNWEGIDKEDDIRLAKECATSTYIKDMEKSSLMWADSSGNGKHGTFATLPESKKEGGGDA